MFNFGSFFTRITRGGEAAPAKVPALRASAAPYEGATSGRRLSTWSASRDAINSVWYQSADQMVARCRDLVRKDGWAAKALEEWVANAIGNGVKPQSLHSKTAIKEKLQKLWNALVVEADVTGTTDVYGLQALAFRAMVEGGECFVRKLFRTAADGLTVALQLQLIEAEQLPFYLARPTQQTPTGNTVKCAIEFDPEGRRTAYYFYREHPGELILGVNPYDLQRIPASEIMHIFRPLRPGQVRGIPWLATAMVRLWELDQYDDAELLRKKMAAMLMGFITRQNPEEAFFPGTTEEAGETGETSTTTDGQIQNATLQPATMQELEPGEDVKFSEPADVGGNFEVFERQVLMHIAAGVGMPYDMLTGDLSQTSYSSIRAGLLSFRRLCEQIQYSVFIHQFCRPLWRAMVEQAVMLGALDVRDYNANREEYLAVEWHTPKWAWVDPEKDVKAEILAVRSGFKARSDVINEMGDDEERVDRQVAKDNERADEFGNIYDSDPRKTAAPKGLSVGGQSAGGAGESGGVEDNQDGEQKTNQKEAA